MKEVLLQHNLLPCKHHQLHVIVRLILLLYFPFLQECKFSQDIKEDFDDHTLLMPTKTIIIIIIIKLIFFA